MTLRSASITASIALAALLAASAASAQPASPPVTIVPRMMLGPRSTATGGGGPGHRCTASVRLAYAVNLQLLLARTVALNPCDDSARASSAPSASCSRRQRLPTREIGGSVDVPQCRQLGP